MSELNRAPGVIGFKGYRLVKLDYSCSPDFEIGSVENGMYHYTFSKSESLLSDTEYQLNLAVNIFFGEDADDSKAPYRLNMEIAGRYDCPEGWQQRWESNALAILFPYVRALVSTLTAQSGREPILLPTMNIAQLFRKAAEQKAQKENS